MIETNPVRLALPTLRGGSRRAALVALLPLAACGPGADPVGTPLTWWHHLEGGVIAEQRPPPPGVDDPYPHVGTTPARPPVPSVAARDALTASLAEQRTETHRLDAHDPIVVTAAPSRAGPAKAGAAPPSSATIDAAGDAAGSAPGGKAAPAAPKPPPTPEQQEANAPMLAMPPPPADAAVVVSGPLPQMPAAPPPPPHFAGFDIPATPLGRLVPDYEPEAAKESNLAFVAQSDVLLPESHRALNAVVARRGAGSI